MNTVCVFGSYLEQNDGAREEIIRLGRILGEKGYTVVSGGFGGTMEYISQGVKDGGGKTVGVTFYKRGKELGKGPNQYVDDEIVTGSILARIEKMIAMSDIFILFPGGTGTLLEFSAVLEYANKKLTSDPLRIIAVGDYWRGIVDVLKPLVPKVENLVDFVPSVDDVLRYVKS